MSTSARTEILDRVRAALLPGQPVVGVPRDYGLAGSAPADDPISVLVERLTDYRANVTVCAEGDVAARVAGLLADAGATRALVPVDLPTQWIPSAIPAIRDSARRSPFELDEIGHVVTGCALAIANIGTLVFDHGPAQGRRAITLVPDHHVCIVREEQIVTSLPDAFARLAETGRSGVPITFVSGPSATSDIELRRVEGVHGPRRLDVVIVTYDQE